MLGKPADKRAMELMARGWDKTADECAAKQESAGDHADSTDESRQTASAA